MTITLPVTERDKSKSIHTLRANGGLPAVVYGPKQEPISVTLEAKNFAKVLKETGDSTIIQITGLKKPIEVLIRDVEFNPVKQQIMHVDFYAVEQGKEMTTNVTLQFIGVAPAEADGVGSVTKVLHEVEVTCMPKDLPAHIDVDISSLVTVEDKIHISDLKVPKGVKIEAEGEEPVAVVSPARVVEVEESTAEVDMSAIEVEKKGKEESESEQAA